MCQIEANSAATDRFPAVRMVWLYGLVALLGGKGGVARR